MDEEVKEKSNKSLWFILGGLGLVIVGLVAGIVALNFVDKNQYDTSLYVNGDYVSNIANEYFFDVISAFADSRGGSVDDAIVGFSDEIEKTNNINLKASFATYGMRFINDYAYGFDYAIDFMGEYDWILMMNSLDSTVKQDAYIGINRICIEANQGTDSKYALCNEASSLVKLSDGTIMEYK